MKVFKVLVVDDESGVREMIGEFLESFWEVRLAGNGQQALAVLEDYEPDIVVTDRVMPQMGGEELIRRIRAARPDLPIVLLTAVISRDERIAAFAAGATAVLGKPIDFNEFLEVIQRATTSPAPS